MKTLCSLLLSLALLLCLAPKLGAVRESDPLSFLPTPSLSAASAVLTDGEGNIFFEKNAHERKGPASTTKIMTALVVARSCELSEIVTVCADAVGVEGSSIYLCEGERLTVEQLLYALLLGSANDAATALACHVSGSEEAFVARMNALASEMGLRNTHFENPHGLYDENHYTTAHELAIIASHALNDPAVARIVATYKTTIPLCGDEGTRVLVNHNKMLRLYDGAIGVKTGFTKKTGRTLVSAAERDGLRLIAVTLDAPSDWDDHVKLLDYGYSRYERVTPFEAGTCIGTIPLCGGVESYLPLFASESLSLVLPRTHEEIFYTVEATGHFLYAPVKQGQIVAYAVCTYDGTTHRIPLLAAADAPAYEPPRQSPLDRILGFFKP